jgi:hypothetical protein
MLVCGGHFDVLRSNSKPADYAADLGTRAFNMRGRDWPGHITGSQVSANLFRVLGIAPLFGRNFADHADRPEAPRTAILSNACGRNGSGRSAMCWVGNWCSTTCPTKSSA